MKHLWAILVAISVCAVSGFAQGEPQANEQRAAGQEPTRAQQIQQRIVDLYLSDFRNATELSEEQFLKVGPIIRQYIRTRFQAATQRAALNQQLDQLLSQPNPSETDIQQLTNKRAEFEGEAGTVETRFITRMRSELSPRQLALGLQFNRKFFDERLPGLLAQARAATAAPRGQRQRPPLAARPNANRNPGKPGNALRNIQN